MSHTGSIDKLAVGFMEIIWNASDVLAYAQRKERDGIVT